MAPLALLEDARPHKIEKLATPKGMALDRLRVIEEYDMAPLSHSGAGQSFGYVDEVKPLNLKPINLIM